MSAIFAGVTAILAKVGVRDVDSNLATAIRTVVILIFAWGIVLVGGAGVAYDHDENVDVPHPFGYRDRRVVAVLLSCRSRSAKPLRSRRSTN
ncbi:MAG: hypothetical protein QM811_06415 [Pirellulales bacterium]